MKNETIENFWQRELQELLERNRKLAAAHQAEAAERGRRQGCRAMIVTTCMDERTAFTEEALGLLPGEAEAYASGGGRISLETFKKICGPALKAAAAAGKDVSICFVTHKCANDSHKGCAAFDNDVAAQIEYFTVLKKEVGREFPQAKAHVIMLDTTAYGLEPVDMDSDDAWLEKQACVGGLCGFCAEEEAHAGHGIFIGDAYRAWVPDHNRYFRLSALNPDIAGNVGIALSVMEHHSAVDLNSTPVVVHLDYPVYAERERTAAAQAALDAALKAVIRLPTAAQKIADGSLKMVQSSTDMETWVGKLL